MVVAGALGITDAGIFGDILCARMVQRGVAGLITDGVVRDIAGVRSTGLPIWSQGVAAPPSVAGLIFEGWQQPVGCGGVAVYPGDLIVADDDGAVVVPAGLAEHVATAGPEQERLEAWIMGEVARGGAAAGLYPPDAATRARYEAEREGLGARGPRRPKFLSKFLQKNVCFRQIFANISLVVLFVFNMLVREKSLFLNAGGAPNFLPSAPRPETCRRRRVKFQKPV